jgi:solute carrier family 25 (mitochondrial citrate transporter), member 1
MTQEKKERTSGMKQTQTTVWQSIVTGSLAGAIEVGIDHPLWSIKTMLQRDQPLNFSFSALYVGVLYNAMSMIPITALQVGLNRALQQVWFKDNNLSSTQCIASAFVAGIGSSLVSCPIEMIMTQQSKTKMSFYAASYILKEAGCSSFYRGLLATAMREGMFTAFFLAGTPLLKSQITSYCTNDAAASLLAGIGAGVGATLASHAFDTIKTRQQDAPINEPINFLRAMKKIYSSHGPYGFFKGSLPRGLRVVSAVTIMSYIGDKMGTYFAQSNATQQVHDEPTIATSPHKSR